jgi:hypothetical protein
MTISSGKPFLTLTVDKEKLNMVVFVVKRIKGTSVAMIVISARFQNPTITQNERTETMGRRKAAALIDEEEYAFEDLDLDAQAGDRTPLVLQREPRSRKEALMAAGVKQIRCVRCSKITSIAESSEFGDRWICRECASEAAAVAQVIADAE